MPLILIWLNWIEFKFKWRKMRCKLVHKVWKSILFYGVDKKKNFGKKQIHKNTFQSFLDENWQTKFQFETI
jgi:hypothetical protein